MFPITAISTQRTPILDTGETDDWKSDWLDEKCYLERDEWENYVRAGWSVDAQHRSRKRQLAQGQIEGSGQALKLPFSDSDFHSDRDT